MKCVIVLLIVCITSSLAAPKTEIGPLSNPSTARTENLAAPPANLNLPPILLPEATPIHEEPQEPRALRIQAPSGRS